MCLSLRFGYLLIYYWQTENKIDMIINGCLLTESKTAKITFTLHKQASVIN